MIHKIRVILDSKEDVFRDIEISEDQTLNDLHEAIKNAFELEGEEMASFYLSDENWEQGEEIAMEDISENESDRKPVMREVSVDQIIPEVGNKMIYVYDFLDLWTFTVEVMETGIEAENIDYPLTVFSFGNRPQYAPEKDMMGEPDFDLDFDEDGYDEDDFDGFGDSFDNIDNW